VVPQVKTGDWIAELPELVVVVGSGGVGKTTVASALALASAQRGDETLVMTFDPSRRLKDALGVEEAGGGLRGDAIVEVSRPRARGEGRLFASLLDARATFDRLVVRHARDEEARHRILDNRYYHHLAGGLAGILEYMAVERLWEVAAEGRFARIVLDTPPTKQALDFLGAPERIVAFMDGGAKHLAEGGWFDEQGRLRVGGPLRGRMERWIDELIGLELMRDMVEFFRAFAPLFAGFGQRSAEVSALLRSERARFALVCGAASERVADALFFARKLEELGHPLGPILVNRVHPRFTLEAGDDDDHGAAPADWAAGVELLHWLGERDRAGIAHLRSLLGGARPVGVLPLLESEPADLDGLAQIAEQLARALA
jgi:anion-transporting  ArsA/GET3 family ATPase